MSLTGVARRVQDQQVRQTSAIVSHGTALLVGTLLGESVDDQC